MKRREVEWAVRNYAEVTLSPDREIAKVLVQ
jgi:hypothetical protein